MSSNRLQLGTKRKRPGPQPDTVGGRPSPENRWHYRKSPAKTTPVPASQVQAKE